jgi:hypothetical protein
MMRPSALASVMPDVVEELPEALIRRRSRQPAIVGRADGRVVLGHDHIVRGGQPGG